MKLYGISGLGADERAFKLLNEHLDKPIAYVPWIDHLPNERLADYAKRLAKTIDTSEDFALIGLSFGGMVSSEMNKYINPKKTLLISSAACRAELPRMYRGAGRLGAIKWLPERFLAPPRALMNFGMGVHSAKNKELVEAIFNDTDSEFLKWAIGAISTWDNTEIPTELIRIHGDNDLVIPMKVKADLVLSGGHLIIIENAEEVAKFIREALMASNDDDVTYQGLS